MVLTCDFQPEVAQATEVAVLILPLPDTQLSSSSAPPCKLLSSFFLLSCFSQPPAVPPDPLEGAEEDVPQWEQCQLPCLALCSLSFYSYKGL